MRRINGYLQSSDTEDKVALITMPTGTGKSGVIAVATTLLPSLHGHRLVLTPWDGLVNQLIDDLRGRFWSRLRRTPQLPPVERLPSSPLIRQIQNQTEPTIYVATIAAISVLDRRAEELGLNVPALFSDFDLVIVDEGHYEPAQHWSQAIRSLGRPTVLLTATPYRNDVKFFPPSSDWRYGFPHHKAVELGRPILGRIWAAPQVRYGKLT